MIVDIELVVGDWLRNHAAVKAITPRVVTKTPGASEATPRPLDTPWVRMTQLDGLGTYPDHLVDFMVQFDCYAGKTNDRGEASLLARTVRAALEELGEAAGIHSDAVVSGVRFTGHAPVPDPDLEPARERVILTVEINAHTAS